MSTIYTLEKQEMHAEMCDFNMTSDGNYFDITHSFNVGSSTYHVLGLRKTRPTYANTYYIFNCTCNRSRSAFLPHIRPHKGHGTTPTDNHGRPHTSSQTKVEIDITEIKKTLTEIIKSEHKSLVTSFRQDINVENNTLLLSIAKETEAVTAATTTAKNDKEEILRLIEKQKSSLENTFERHASNIISSIELLQTTIKETSNSQHKQLQSLYQLQHELSETIEREVENIMVKHFETYRSTSLDITTIKQIQSTLIETFETRSTTTKADNDDTMKRFLLDQKQQLTDLITKQHHTYELGISEIKQLQTTIIQTINNISTPSRDDQNDSNALKRLFLEQRQYLADLIREQHHTYALDISETKQVQTTTIQANNNISTPSRDDQNDNNALKRLFFEQRQYLADLIREQHHTYALGISETKQVHTTTIQTNNNISTPSRDDQNDNDNDALKRLFFEQRQFLTELITKQQNTYALSISEIKQLQTTIMQTNNNISTPSRDGHNDNDNDALKRLFFEQRQFLTELITKQQQSLSLNLIKQTVINAINEQHSSVVSTTNISTGMTRDPRPFKISIKTGESAQVFAKLNIDGIEFPSELHTLCQRDPSKVNTVDCFVAPPIRDGPCELTIYAKTKNETEYRAAICILMSYLNVAQPITFPQLYPPFNDYQCVLIEPLRRFLRQDEQVLIHMLIPGAHEIKIRNGDDDIVLNNDEYRHGIVKKKVQIQGNLLVYGRWNRQADSLICAFEMN